MITFLTIIFLIFLVFIVFYGYDFMMKKTKNEISEFEKCEICRNEFDKKILIEKEIGDFKISYFCVDCVKNLGEELNK